MCQYCHTTTGNVLMLPCANIAMQHRCCKGGVEGPAPTGIPTVSPIRIQGEWSVVRMPNEEEVQNRNKLDQTRTHGSVHSDYEVHRGPGIVRRSQTSLEYYSRDSSSYSSSFSGQYQSNTYNNIVGDFQWETFCCHFISSIEPRKCNCMVNVLAWQ